MNRAVLTKLHLALAAFMFPAVLMFLGTGVLYTWGSKGAWQEETVTIALKQPLVPSETALKQLVQAQLDARGWPIPSGKASVSGEGETLAFDWTGARSEVSLRAGPEPLVAEATLRQASTHRWLVQLHKAKGSTAFKLYATFLALVLFALVLSGLVMGWMARPMRRLTFASALAGLGAFVGFVLLG